jgi:hypothetical protein
MLGVTLVEVGLVTGQENELAIVRVRLDKNWIKILFIYDLIL